MEFIWHILLTVCVSGQCMSQDVQWFEGAEAKSNCYAMLESYKEIPIDGDWETVDYVCKPLGGKQV